MKMKNAQPGKEKNNKINKKQESLRTTRVTQTDSCFIFLLNHQYQYVPARTPIGDRICQ